MPKLLFADGRGKIFSHPRLEAVGMKAGAFFKLNTGQFVKLPPGSQIFKLPFRAPVGYDSLTRQFVVLDKYFAVAAFISPGFTLTHNSAYKEIPGSKGLPLFSYGAVGSSGKTICTTAIHVDRDLRHDSRFIDMDEVKKNIKKFRHIFPKNRLVRHLETCALVSGCAGAQNFFLARCEGPLPTSPRCNASCLGCISQESLKGCPGTQARIKFTPSPQEVAEVALFHIANVYPRTNCTIASIENTIGAGVKAPVVSFGQGCEGEPLLAERLIEKSIRLIRKGTAKGIINMNTNASRPDALRNLFDAGLDSIRVSMNSARPEFYTRYYKPGGYTFSDVVRSIRVAKDKKRFVSVNYLVMPGFTDREEEFAAFKRFIKEYKIDMVQWRNLNFDPMEYFRILKLRTNSSNLIGVKEVMNLLKEEFPFLLMGYFNPHLSLPTAHF